MLSLFMSYSHKDEALRDELEIHLAMIKREGLISAWHDRRIGAGKPIDDEIDLNLEAAAIILMLASPYFLASDYCYERELKRALERHERGEARVIPVILEPCDWQNSPLGKLRATPADGKPVSKHANIHDGLLEVARDVRDVINELVEGMEEIEDVTEEPTPAADLTDGRAIIRSSNLRVRHAFSDRERDDYLVDAFRYIRVYFENSLAELAARNDDIDVRFYEIHGGRFTASVYAQGNRSSACAVWLEREGVLGAGIYFARSTGEGTNSFSESLSVDDDGHALLLKPTMSLAMGSADSDLTLQGGAEHLWAMFMKPLQ